ncbi:MAG: hypothetical protein RIT27_2045 [Pseudomonadota bacterium]|jgi:glycosyltransferase involved in cell wall biosynthesis
MTKQVINAFGYFSGFTGYNIHTFNFFSALQKIIPVVAHDLRFHEVSQINQHFISRHYSENEIINICISYGNSVGFLNNLSGMKIGYTAWGESTKVPDDWKAPLESMNQIWIPSHFAKDVLIKNGLTANKIKVVPEGIDPQIFHPSQPKRQDIANIKGFKFLFIGQYGERKGISDLIKGFDEEFYRTPDVWLVLSCHFAWPFEANFDLQKKIQSFNLKSPEKIIIVSNEQHHQKVASLYAACDCFVSPNRAEGWGLPITEAMACGLPVIVTNYSGQTEYLTEQNAFLLNYALEDIKIPFFKAADGYYGQWAKPDFNHLKYLMRYVFEHPDEAKQRGLFAAQDMLQNWTWQHAAQKALQAMAKFNEPQAFNFYLTQNSILQMLQNNQVENAIQYLQQQIKLFPQNADLYNDLGVVLMLNPQYHLQGLQLFKHALQLAPQKTVFQTNLQLAETIASLQRKS